MYSQSETQILTAGENSLRLPTLTILSVLPLAAAITLPPDGPPKQTGPQTYHFTLEYTFADTKGEINRRERASAFRPELFKTFPPMAMQERNLVWDSIMFETFARTPFSKLTLNESQSIVAAQDVSFAGAGNFHNRNVQLTWSGVSERDGQ